MPRKVLTNIRGAPGGRALPSLFHSGDVLCVFVLAVAMQGWPDTQEKLEGVAEIVAILAIEGVGAIIDRELCAESDVEAVAV
jgi:hypothetical protein